MSTTAPWQLARRLALYLMLTCAGPAHAAWSYRIDILGGTEATASFEAGMSSNIAAAMDLWTKHLAGAAAVDIELVFSHEVAYAEATSLASVFVRHEGTVAVFEQGLAHEIRTGIDPNSSKADLRILLNPVYASCELWFDEQPARRWAQVPSDRTDAVSLFAHELGHALAFNGWWDPFRGRMPLDYGSTWDLNTWYDGSLLYFTGAQAVSVYGGPVPVTTGNNWHVGNATGAGTDLVGDVMNGVRFHRGTRYEVSALDLAMLADMGVALAPVPEPQSAWLLTAGLLGLAAWRRGRARSPGEGINGRGRAPRGAISPRPRPPSPPPAAAWRAAPRPRCCCRARCWKSRTAGSVPAAPAVRTGRLRRCGA